MKFKCFYEKVKDSNEGEICSWYGTVVDLLEKEDGFEATITGRGASFHVIVGKHEYGNYLCIPNWQMGCELADPSDTFWNQEQVEQLTGIVDATTIVAGISRISIQLLSNKSKIIPAN